MYITCVWDPLAKRNASLFGGPLTFRQNLHVLSDCPALNVDNYVAAPTVHSIGCCTPAQLFKGVSTDPRNLKNRIGGVSDHWDCIYNSILLFVGKTGKLACPEGWGGYAQVHPEYHRQEVLTWSQLSQLKAHLCVAQREVVF